MGYTLYYPQCGGRIEAMKQKLAALLGRARKYRMTAKELEAQQVSFAYGNAPKSARTTKKAVRAALQYTSPARKRA